jgi:hypothetical protein
VPITPFLKGQAFDPELVEAMGAAFVSTCDSLGLAERNDPITTLVAEKIIELAQRGLRSPTAIHMLALRELKSNPQ